MKIDLAIYPTVARVLGLQAPDEDSDPEFEGGLILVIPLGHMEVDGMGADEFSQAQLVEAFEKQGLKVLSAEFDGGDLNLIFGPNDRAKDIIHDVLHRYGILKATILNP